ncbi:yrdC domain-containing protein, mitochondrial [Dorcoceras hygrometricum]|uniref:Threonylcarbamoyl-AMP synthase n=1 Tax=Dorcoceras hygrometricum TaxID=472368 RepID=A0A2Z7D3C7_9LAMI|nr:yrdC domain-containing protein, mitochondrial [Dorcoceras hygrometricum]
MAWRMEKCDGNGMGIGEFGVLRPAMEDYAQEAVKAVKAGKVIVVPTDTLYGFACDACLRRRLVTFRNSMDTVHRIYEIKGRKYRSPLAICVGDVEDIQRFAITDHLSNVLLNFLLPGPVTLVLRRGVSSILEKFLNLGLESIGVRVPGYNFIRFIARESRSALALTSANLSGRPSSLDIKDFENLWKYCAYIYDGGVIPYDRVGSTVVDLTEPGRYDDVTVAATIFFNRYDDVTVAATIFFNRYDDVTVAATIFFNRYDDVTVAATIFFNRYDDVTVAATIFFNRYDDVTVAATIFFNRYDDVTVAATIFFNRYDDVTVAESRFLSISNADVIVAARSFFLLVSCDCCQRKEHLLNLIANAKRCRINLFKRHRFAIANFKYHLLNLCLCASAESIPL